MVKTQAHRKLFPNVPDEKIVVVPNGLNPDEFTETVEKNPYLVLNTSSPERHIDATMDAFERLIEKYPDKPWRLAWYYGWHNYEKWHKDDPEMMAFMKKQQARFEKLKEKGLAEGGHMISQTDIARKYLEAGIFFYPTQFYEIHCISASKAQLAGCYPVTSDFAALDETVQYGTKVHTSGEKWGKGKFFGDCENTEKYAEIIATLGNEEAEEIKGSREWAKETYNWNRIAGLWLSEI
jgi:glycosyltransferase involved in cell wall biosynthesis